MTVHGVPVDINGDRLGIYFARYGQVEYVSVTISKAGIATRDFVLQATLTRKFRGDPQRVDVLGENNAHGYRPYCWKCGALGNMSKVCPGKNAMPQPSKASAAELFGQAHDGE